MFTITWYTVGKAICIFSAVSVGQVSHITYPTSRTHLFGSEDSGLNASSRKKERDMLSHFFHIMRLILLAWKLKNVFFSGNRIKLCKCILVEKSMKAMGCMKTSLEQEKYRMRKGEFIYDRYRCCFCNRCCGTGLETCSFFLFFFFPLGTEKKSPMFLTRQKNCNNTD